ncbi:hypothetical protein EJB05_56257, partial [Eragrostis curvula]
MKTVALAPHAKKRRTKPLERREPHEPHLLAPAAVSATDAGGEEREGIDRISSLPDAIFGEIITLLPTKDGVRTQALASRWRHLWLTAPLNLDLSGLPKYAKLHDIITHVLAAHQGPARRFSMPKSGFYCTRATLDTWFRSPALNNLQELETNITNINYWLSPPPSSFSFWTTLRVFTFVDCLLDVKIFHCPQLRQLGLDGAIISDSCLCNMVAGSPVLECLLLKNCIGFCSIRINSPSLISIGFSYRGVPSAELIIEDAPLLQRLLQLERCGPLQNLCTVSFAVEMCSVRFLAVEVYTSIDMIIDILRCFPCLEKLYIKLSGGTYHWHKHRNHVKCLDNNLRTVVLKGYRAKRSNVKLVTFFVLNAKMLEQMRFEATGFKYKNCKKIARHHRLLQLEKRVLSARFHFTVGRCLQNLPHIKHVHDLSKANPFEYQLEESHRQELPLRAGGGERDGIDRISALPDEILGEIISLLPTNDGARTQALASRWRRLWLSAPLNIDPSGLPTDSDKLLDIVSHVLAAHQGPARRFSMPYCKCSLYLLNRAKVVESWFRSPVLNNLQELELGYVASWIPLPATAFYSCTTLRVVTIAACSILDDTVKTFHFPQLRQLVLERTRIPEGWVCNMIAGSPVLEFLLLNRVRGFTSMRINSPSLVSFGIDCMGRSTKLTIEDAPLLQRLLELDSCGTLHVSVISAPKLDTLGCLTDYDCPSNKLVFGTTVIQKLCAVSFATEICSVKVLAIIVQASESMDMIIGLLRCFPCLEKLYIQLSSVLRDKKHWHKLQNHVKCVDNSLRTVVLKGYRGTKSHVKLVNFLVLNAKMLEVMRLEATGFIHENSRKFIAEHRRLRQLEKRTLRSARIHFTIGTCEQDIIHIKHVHDLSKANPFECMC